MNFIRSTLSFGLLAAAIGCLIVNHSSYSQTNDTKPEKETSADSKPEQTEREFPAHEYANDVNTLMEGWIPVTDNFGKRATHFRITEEPAEALPDVKFEVLWTSPTQYEWNYAVPELHDGKDLFNTKYPSVPLYFERKHNLSYKQLLNVSIPDTPYAFYILNGKLSPYFYDSKKDVIWRLNSKDMDVLFSRMHSISVSSKKLELMAPGGDMAEFLTVDFSSRMDSPKISTWRRFDGP